MNLDLNLVPVVHPPQNDQPHNMNFENLLRETTTNQGLTPVEVAASGADNSITGDTYENGDECNFFDCNICLDLANDPVVTCCGHLFCWPCIYRWLVVHSNAKQCPICKGEVTIKTVTPIYSRVNHTLRRQTPNASQSFKIPSRPAANRIESWRHSFQRDTLDLPIIEMVRRLDNNRFHLSRDPLSINPQEISSTLLLNRIFTSRGIRSGRDSVPATLPDVTVDLPDDHIHDLAFAESFVDSYFRDHPDERNQEELPLIDRHSMSSVTDIIQSEITGSRRRREPSTSTFLDIDSGDSRFTRRRLH